MTIQDEEHEKEEEGSQFADTDASIADRKAIPLMKPKHPMELLLKKGGFSSPKIGEVVHGAVIERKGAELFVDLGIFGTGIVFGREFRAAGDLVKKVSAGDEISGKVVELDNEDGYVELSLKQAGADQSWADLKKMAEAGDVLEIPVLEANRGGLLLEAKGVKGFLPASQLSQANYPRVDGGDKEKIFQELQKLVGKVVKVKILDINPIEQKLIFTEKGQTSEELGKALGKYTVGDIVEGEITGVVDFGAFLKFDNAGLEGLIHISEIDWTLIENPREVLKVGDKMQAKIIDVQGDKVSLSLKQLKEDPWTKFAEQFTKGDVIKGKVTKFNPYGAFVSLDSQIHPVRNELQVSEQTEASESVLSSSEKSGRQVSNGIHPVRNGSSSSAESDHAELVDKNSEKITKSISNGIQGLVHISEFGTEANMKEEIEIGREYEFKVLLIDAKEHRMSLGIVREKKEEEKKEE